MRHVLDDKSVDAVWIATPDHWHAPATILACDAGKHVYVEKPCSHNIREGRLMIEAARRNKRVVQVGTQSRSTAHVRQAMEKLHAGAIGDVLVSKAWNSQLRRSIGHAQPSDPPSTLDYDLWTGPAPLVPYQANLLPGIWRWWYDFGCGDMGNDGVHDIDIACWGLGVDTHPSSIVALGGKYFFDDDQQFPDTQYVVFEYPGDGKVGHKRQLIFEQRIWSPYVQEGYENGNAFYGTKGMMLLGKRGGYKIFGPRNKLIEEVYGRRARSGGPPSEFHGLHPLAASGRTPTSRSTTARARCATWATSRPACAGNSSSTRRPNESLTIPTPPAWSAASIATTIGPRRATCKTARPPTTITSVLRTARPGHR